MARMLPAEPRLSTRSEAERRVFDVVKSRLPDTWTALHSLGVSMCRGKPWTEIDFVLIGPPGVLCIEVKGGGVSREDGIWYSTNARGQRFARREGPFEQAAVASVSLHKYLSAHLRRASTPMVGYGVVTPDILWNVEGADIVPELVCDASQFESAFNDYVSRIVAYWRRRLGRSDQAEDPDRKELDEIVALLRGDFDLRPSMRSQIDQVSEELIRLTREQYAVLDALVENERVLVRGGAGTGKTLLALEDARRRAGLGNRVLLLCFNRNLAGALRRAVAGSSGIRVDSFFSFMADELRLSGLDKTLPSAEADELLTRYYPPLCVEALTATGHAHSWDTLIVDEAQDLLQENYLKVLDAVLQGGLNNGRWLLLLDPLQDIFRSLDQSAEGSLVALHPAQFRLTKNCRNTTQVAAATRLLSGAGVTESTEVSGPAVETRWYRDDVHERDAITGALLDLLGSGVSPGEIVILSPRRRENSCLMHGLSDPRIPFRDWSTGPAGTGTEVRFTTIQAFKGLESEVVFLIGVENLGEPLSLMQLYVGASRAKAVLVVFLHERLRAEYDRRAREFGRDFAGGALDPRAAGEGEGESAAR